MEYSKEFKEAISNFTSSEKDKLIIRLLKKDRILSHRLYFELIDEETVDDKRNALEEIIKTDISAAAKRYGRTKYFLPNIRKVSAKITEHVKITTDKLGEVSLNLLLVAEVLKNIPKFGDHHKTHIYLLNKIFRAFVLTKKLDEDYFLELKENYDEILDWLSNDEYLTKLSINNGLDFNWFDPEKIPDHIDIIVKEIKAQGFLR